MCIFNRGTLLIDGPKRRGKTFSFFCDGSFLAVRISLHKPDETPVKTSPGHDWPKRQMKRKHTMKRTALIAGLTIFAIAGTAVTASAMGPGKGGHKSPMLEFSALDLDGDGLLTQDEMHSAMQAEAAKRFAAADTDGDGALSVEEMLAKAEGERAERMQRRVTKMIEKRDTNGDGLLSAEEMQGGNGNNDRKGRLFSKLDQNEDGALSEEEFAAMKERFGKKRMGGKHGQRGENGGGQDQN